MSNARRIPASPSTTRLYEISLRDHLAANYLHLHRKLQRCLGCADAASDSLHDAWLRLGNMSTALTIENVNAYIHRVACNAALDRLRGERSGRYVDNADQTLEQIADDVPGLDVVIEARRMLEAVARAFECLPPRHRAVLLAVCIEGESRQTVADRYGLSLRKVDTALRHALDFCAEQAGENIQSAVTSSRHKLFIARLLRGRCASVGRP